MATKDNIARLYDVCVERAKNAAGGERAFWVIGATLRIALVAQEILILVDNQDEGTSDATVRGLLASLRDRLTSDASLQV